MCRITFFIILLYSVQQFDLHAQTNYSYILFDKDSLEEDVSDTVRLKRSYAEIVHKAGKYANQTIYNFLFQNLKSHPSKDLLYQSLKKAANGEATLPRDMLVTVTPLAKKTHTRQDITNKVRSGEVNFKTPTDLLNEGIRELYHAKYAPLGVFEKEPTVSIFRSDIKLVTKEKNRYYLLNDTTFTALYLIDNTGIYYPIEYDCCTIHTIGNTFKKGSKVPEFSPASPNYPSRFSGKLFMDFAETIAHKDASTSYRLLNYWTNNIGYITGAVHRGRNQFNVFSGIGDFQFLSEYGIINGNFLDFFAGPWTHYDVDKVTNPTFNLFFTVDKLNGIPYKKFIKRLKNAFKDPIYIA